MIYNTSLVRRISPYPPPVVDAAKGPPSDECADAMTLDTLREVLMSMGEYRLGERQVKNMDRGAFRKKC
jgi:hypothetical protein